MVMAWLKNYRSSRAEPAVNLDNRMNLTLENLQVANALGALSPIEEVRRRQESAITSNVPPDQDICCRQEKSNTFPTLLTARSSSHDLSFDKTLANAYRKLDLAHRAASLPDLASGDSNGTCTISSSAKEQRELDMRRIVGRAATLSRFDHRYDRV